MSLLALTALNKGRALFYTFENLQQPNEIGSLPTPCNVPCRLVFTLEDHFCMSQKPIIQNSREAALLFTLWSSLVHLQFSVCLSQYIEAN